MAEALEEIAVIAVGVMVGVIVATWIDSKIAAAASTAPAATS